MKIAVIFSLFYTISVIYCEDEYPDSESTLNTQSRKSRTTPYFPTGSGWAVSF